MKNTKWVVVALLVSLAHLNARAKAELVQNGGFEDGFTGWSFTGDGTNDVASISTDTPTGTGSSADLDINQGNGLPWLIQDVPVVGGTTYFFSAAVREIEPNSPDAWIAGQVWMLENANAGVILTSKFVQFSDPTWTTNGFTITAPTIATVARILFTPQNPAFGVGTGQYRIDNVSLTVPEPAGIVCCISGVLAALMLHRSPCMRKQRC